MAIASENKDNFTPTGYSDFHFHSGNIIERIIFNYRPIIILFCAICTVALGWNATKLTVNASFSRMLPQSHSYIQNFFANADSLRGLGNSIRIVVENRKGDIYDPAYLEVLRKINDTVFLMPGVDRSYLKSLWTPAVRWIEVTEEGARGGPVMPEKYDGSGGSIDRFRQNVEKAGIVGTLVANDRRSSMVFVPLLDHDPATGQPFDYSQFSRQLESKVRSLQSDSVHIYIVGFAKLMADLIDGLGLIMGYFLVAAAIGAVIIYFFTRCVRSTATIITCSLIAVVWQLGIIHLLGFDLDPYSILVPFLVFAIGVSHGAQKMNGIMQDIGRGEHRYVAARSTFRRLFLAGFSALVADAVGFAVLMVIDIPVIHDLALIASAGVTVLIFTNLVLLPVFLSYVGVSPKAAAASIKSETEGAETSGIGRLIHLLDRCTERRWAGIILLVAAGVAAGGLMIGRNVKVGDLDPGAPELRADSRYNKDNAYIIGHYALSSDQLAVIVRTPPGGIASFPTMLEMDRLEQRLREIPGVQTTSSAGGRARLITAANFENNPKWLSINRDQGVVNDSMNTVYIVNPELVNKEFSVGPVVAYLTDHKADTLRSVVAAVESFAAEHDTSDRKFLLAAGSAGIEAATNIVVEEANNRMLYLVYGAVIALCFLSFRNWRAVVVAVIPLALTSVLCEALMVFLGIGVKVATLPVIALGVGIGVDYALYLVSVQLSFQRQGLSLRDAYGKALRFTGKVVALVGVTLAAGVIVWGFSPIKFQADMGILLAFMFLWNMVGALVLIPALSHFLLSDPVKLPTVSGECTVKNS